MTAVIIIPEAGTHPDQAGKLAGVAVGSSPAKREGL